MASVRTTRRLGACGATVLAVTVGAGVLASPGAVAAPAAAAGGVVSASQADEAKLPVGAEVVSTGDTGYLTSRRDDAGTAILEWHKYGDGSVLPINTGTQGYDSNSDIVVTGDGASMVFLRDMREGGTSSTFFELASVFKPGARLVGVVGDNLFVSVPTTGDYHELWQLSKVNGVDQKTKLTSRAYGLDYKVVASTGHDLLILGSARVFSGPTYRTEYWKALTNVNNHAVVDWEGAESVGPWTQDSTGAYTADYKAWSEYPAQGTQLVVSPTGARKTFPMDSSLSRTVIAGIAGNTLLYGVPGKAGDEAQGPLYARGISDGSAPYKLLEHFSSVAHAPDGSLLVRGSTAGSDGLFRITDGGAGVPSVTLVADTGFSRDIVVTESKVPTAVNLERPGTTTAMQWTLSRPTATVDLTLTHTATGRKLVRHLAQPVDGTRFVFDWDGALDGISAPNGAYDWQITATPTDGTGRAVTASGRLEVNPRANPHDFNDNGSTDVLARDASGVLWRDDLFDWPADGRVTTAKRTKIGGGWQIYNQIEAAGNLAGPPTGDLVARDASGVLWLYLGKGDGTFASRTQVGGGWQAYNKITGGGDLTGDGRPDLLATDTSGVLWLYRGTGSVSAPFAGRTKVGGGWQIYNQITAVGDIAGGAAGDLVARDASGVLWLYQGDGTGNFASRVRIGGGWNAFSQLVGAGDVTGDGRPDMVAYGANGTYVYQSTGSATAPFTRQSTNLYAGEGAQFNSVA
ncbi:FG-GAP repeat domain-containing protein [Streptomyces sp. YS-3]|uniref:FG-GAP repeat domain-containing protein n=1 Tax=Streptomyces sp. YS-3 TaxID=3381352 RepID=UPI003862BADA